MCSRPRQKEDSSRDRKEDEEIGLSSRDMEVMRWRRGIVGRLCSGKVWGELPFAKARRAIW